MRWTAPCRTPCARTWTDASDPDRVARLLEPRARVNATRAASPVPSAMKVGSKNSGACADVVEDDPSALLFCSGVELSAKVDIAIRLGIPGAPPRFRLTVRMFRR